MSTALQPALLAQQAGQEDGSQCVTTVQAASGHTRCIKPFPGIEGSKEWTSRLLGPHSPSILYFVVGAMTAGPLPASETGQQKKQQKIFQKQ